MSQIITITHPDFLEAFDTLTRGYQMTVPAKIEQKEAETINVQETFADVEQMKFKVAQTIEPVTLTGYPKGWFQGEEEVTSYVVYSFTTEDDTCSFDVESALGHPGRYDSYPQFTKKTEGSQLDMIYNKANLRSLDVLTKAVELGVMHQIFKSPCCDIFSGKYDFKDYAAPNSDDRALDGEAPQQQDDFAN